MQTITVVDARMGRGKSSAAIQYMNEHKAEKRFMYITPYLTEVERICECCDFDQPDSDRMSKSSELKLHLRQRHNVAASHSLFYLMDEEALALVENGGYTLIIDEEIETVSKVQITAKDFGLITSSLAVVDENGRCSWIDKNYEGKLSGYKDIADTGSLFVRDETMLEILNPDLLTKFDDVFMLTYLFRGSAMEAYLKYAGFDYRIVGIEGIGRHYRFSNAPDSPPPLDLHNLITIVDTDKMNRVGDDRTALSKNWYAARSADNKDIKVLRNNLDNFFRHMTGGSNETRLWTCFKDDADKIMSFGGRYRKNFLQVNARATNEFAAKTDVAYMINRFADPNIVKFFGTCGIEIDLDTFALSGMLQWIWRSAIRNNQHINLYIPSKRMRTLLLNWIDHVSEGGVINEPVELPKVSA